MSGKPLGDCLKGARPLGMLLSVCRALCELIELPVSSSVGAERRSQKAMRGHRQKSLRKLSLLLSFVT
eukprot:2988712-Amphidinium_carterae.2